MKIGLVFWFTGLSGSGKTTVANGTKLLLEKKGYSVLMLDGDDIRRELHANLGFSEEDIKKNNSLIAGLCKKHRRDHDVILVPIISPYDISRKRARSLLSKGFYEIYFSADLDTVIKRDIKGLYSKAMRNEIDNLIGYSPGNIYEAPENPDFSIDSAKSDINDSIKAFYEFVEDKINTR